MRKHSFTLAKFHSHYCLITVLAVCCAVISGCDTESGIATEVVVARDRPGTPIANQDFDPEFTANIRLLTDDYLLQIDADFADVGTALALLQSSIAEFLANPSTRSLDAARESWLSAHNAYELTALHRYFANRILPDAQALQLFQLQYRINQWPILPGYLDYVGDYPDSGIVNDPTVILSIQNLRDQHGVFEVTEATLGFHVIEYLLWGLNEEEKLPRPATDYLEAKALSSSQSTSGITLDQLPTNRRRQLLTLTTQALQADFQALLAIWDANNIAVRNQLQLMAGPELLSVLTSAMTDMLTEELLVRSLYLLLNGEYVDSIQSPFSHSTQNAVSAQLSSLERLLLETRTSENVTLDALISTLSEDFADFFYQNFDASKECLVLLYSTLQVPTDTPASSRAEFEIVECINLVTNMIDHLGQVAAISN